MRKFLTAIFAVLLTTSAWAEPAFTITCENVAGDGCTIKGNYSSFVVTKCSEISQGSLTKEHPIMIKTNFTGEICASEINKAQKCEQGSDVRSRYVFSGDIQYYVVFCSDDYLDTKGTQWDDIIDADWPYDKKKCVGSGGTLNGQSCTCPNPNTTPVNGECLCKKGNTKYLVNGNCNEGTSCTSTGGSGNTGQKCTCPDNMESKPIRNGAQTHACWCKEGYQYRDPMRRWEGCVKINDEIKIFGTVVDYDNDETIPNVNLSIEDASIGRASGITTDQNGSFFTMVPNTAYIKFSMVGYRPQIWPATELKDKTIKLVIAPVELKGVDVTADSPCTISGGILQKNGTCECDIEEKHLKPTTDKKQCECEDLEKYEFDEKEKTCKAKTNGDNGGGAGNDAGGAGDETTTPPTTTPNSTTSSKEDAAKKLADAREKYNKAQGAEQSFANRAVTAGATAATGLGAMQLAEGLAEQNADRAAETDMNAYIETMKCSFGKGQQVTLGNEDVTLPGGNELLDLYTEYKQTAERLKTTKKALGLRAGIESEVLYDKAQTGLYQYANTGKTGGGYTSLYNALTDETGDDAAAWASQKDISAQKVKAGAIATIGGTALGIGGNLLVNGVDDIKNKINKNDEDGNGNANNNKSNNRRNGQYTATGSDAVAGTYNVSVKSSGQVSAVLTQPWTRLFKTTDSTEIDADESVVNVNGQEKKVMAQESIDADVEYVIDFLNRDKTNATVQCVTVDAKPEKMAEIVLNYYKEQLAKQNFDFKIQYQLNQYMCCNEPECEDIYTRVYNRACSGPIVE